MRDPADVIADALARDPHVTLTGSTERDVARFLLAALRDEYGTWRIPLGYLRTGGSEVDGTDVVIPVPAAEEGGNDA